MSFVNNIRRTAAQYINALAEKDAALDAFTKKYKGYYSQEAFGQKRRILEQERAALDAECRQALQRLAADYKAEVSRRYLADGSAITDDARLLDGSIPLQQKDLEALFDRNTGNMTMLRMIHGYAMRHSVYMDRAFYTEEMRREAADSLAQYAAEALSDRWKAAFLQDDKTFAGIVPPALAGE